MEKIVTNRVKHQTVLDCNLLDLQRFLTKWTPTEMQMAHVLHSTNATK